MNEDKKEMVKAGGKLLSQALVLIGLIAFLVLVIVRCF